MFLSSNCGEMSTALTILSNVATHLPEDKVIPQLSLIVSCLMQDLIHSSTNKSEILQTLIKLISRNPEGVQEHDLQFAVLPLLSQKQAPVIIVLVLKLLDECETNKLTRIFRIILYRIYLILSMDTMMYPEVLSAAISLLATLTMHFNIISFLELTDLIPFAEDVIKQIKQSGKYPHLLQILINSVFILEKHSKPDMEIEQPKTNDQKVHNPEDDEKIFITEKNELKKMESRPILDLYNTNVIDQNLEEDEEDEEDEANEYDENRKKVRVQSDAVNCHLDEIESDEPENATNPEN